MKLSIANLNEDQLKKFIRQFSNHEYVFHQNDMGNTMFVIIAGSIELLDNRNGQEFVVGTLTPGQVLGEKAMLTESPYKRTYSARTKDDTSLLEFTNKHLKIVEAIIPDFASRILQIAAKRLDRANRIISILRPLDPFARLIAAIEFLADEGGKKVAEGVEVPMGVADIEQLCSIDPQIIASSLEAFVDAKILRKTKNGYLLTDKHALSQYLPDLKERIAA